MSSFVNELQQYIAANPLKSAVIATASIMILQRIREDYQSWLALGPGGAPHNPVGYVLAYSMNIFASKDIKSTACYDEANAKAYLQDIPTRKGQGPIISKWIFPVRQLNARAERSRVAQINSLIQDLAANNELIFTAPSLLEGGTSQALLIQDADPTKRDTTARNREIFHCHGTEGSSHTILSPVDAAQILDRGWGERHPLSGRMLGLPLSYVMIYAPRDDEELEVLKQVAQAAVSYALERRKNGQV